VPKKSSLGGTNANTRKMLRDALSSTPRPAKPKSAYKAPKSAPRGKGKGR
jgi:hypothetical protein